MVASPPQLFGRGGDRAIAPMESAPVTATSSDDINIQQDWMTVYGYCDGGVC